MDLFRKCKNIYTYFWKFNKLLNRKKASRQFLIQLDLDLGPAFTLHKLHFFFI